MSYMYLFTVMKTTDLQVLTGNYDAMLGSWVIKYYKRKRTNKPHLNLHIAKSSPPGDCF